MCAPHEPAAAYDLACSGLKAYDLQKCLRAKREAAEEAGGDVESVEDAKMKLKQYEQPGDLVTLPSGVQYRELLAGTGRAAQLGNACNIRYTVYRLSSGAYFKYSSGGTPVLLWALGYGTEGKRDVGDTYRFVLGDPRSLPIAATLGIVGMQEGGRRRILVPPALGWARDDTVGPPPDTFGASRRLANYKDGPLLFEAELVRCAPASNGASSLVTPELLAAYDRIRLSQPYSMPAPTPYGGPKL